MFIFDPIPNQAAQRHVNTLKARENLSELNYSEVIAFVCFKKKPHENQNDCTK